MGTSKSRVAGVATAAVIFAGSIAAALTGVFTTPPVIPTPTGGIAGNNITHVVVLFQENFSFDAMLGLWCVQTGRCDGAVTAHLNAGHPDIPIGRMPDIAPGGPHDKTDQIQAMDGGLMDAFNTMNGCNNANGYACIAQTDNTQAYTTWALANRFVVNDRTFEPNTNASWMSHFDLVASFNDGFIGDNPLGSGQGGGNNGGWGCDSGIDAVWNSGAGGNGTGGTNSNQPTCDPDFTLNAGTYPFGGAYKATSVVHADTILDRYIASSIPYTFYAGQGPSVTQSISGYSWSTCPTVARCLYGPTQGGSSHWTTAQQVVTDAAAGNLPAVSYVTPTQPNSQHGNYSITQGENWIANVVSAIENGPNWPNTAIFLTWDDCGCYYDHVNPLPYNNLWGPRVPMVIISPYAKVAYTDHTATSLLGIMAFIEHNWGLTAMTSADSTAYYFQNAFTTTPHLEGVNLPTGNVPASSQAAVAAYLHAHPAGNPEDT